MQAIRKRSKFKKCIEIPLLQENSSLFPNKFAKFEVSRVVSFDRTMSGPKAAAPQKMTIAGFGKPIPSKYSRIAKYDHSTEEGIRAFMKRVDAFKKESRQCVVLRPDMYKPFLYDALEFLKEKYCATLAKEASVAPHTVSIDFIREDRDTYADPVAGTICFSEVQLNRDMIDDSVSDYKAEQPIRKQWVSCKEDGLIWLLLHEFCHLFRGYDVHNDRFCRRVEQLARENAFLFAAQSLPAAAADAVGDQ